MPENSANATRRGRCSVRPARTASVRGREDQQARRSRPSVAGGGRAFRGRSGSRVSSRIPSGPAGHRARGRRGGSLGADPDLPRLGDLPRPGRSRWPPDRSPSSFTVQGGVAHQEEVEDAPSGSPPTCAADQTGWCGDPSDLPHGRAHPAAPPGRPGGMLGSSNRRSTASPPHLHQVSTILVGDGRAAQRTWCGQDVAHLLRADPALAGEPLGELGGPEDVDEGGGCRRPRGRRRSGVLRSQSTARRGT